MRCKTCQHELQIIASSQLLQYWSAQCTYNSFLYVCFILPILSKHEIVLLDHCSSCWDKLPLWWDFFSYIIIHIWKHSNQFSAFVFSHRCSGSEWKQHLKIKVIRILSTQANYPISEWNSPSCKKRHKPDIIKTSHWTCACKCIMMMADLILSHHIYFARHLKREIIIHLIIQQHRHVWQLGVQVEKGSQCNLGNFAPGDFQRRIVRYLCYCCRQSQVRKLLPAKTC